MIREEALEKEKELKELMDTKCAEVIEKFKVGDEETKITLEDYVTTDDFYHKIFMKVNGRIKNAVMITVAEK